MLIGHLGQVSYMHEHVMVDVYSEPLDSFVALSFRINVETWHTVEAFTLWLVIGSLNSTLNRLANVD